MARLCHMWRLYVMSNWYALQVETGKEDTACEFLNKLVNKEEYIAFFPQVEVIFKSSKLTSKYLRPMFPGYIIADSILEERAFITQTYKYIRFSKCIFKILGKENIYHIKLSEYEKQFLLGFCNDEYIVEDSKGFIKGDNIIVTSGPLMGMESVIRKIDRHKRRAEIEMEFMGDIRRINVALEIVKKI